MMQHRHFKLYKPAGYLSQFVNHQNRRKNKKLLGELGKFPDGTMAIGRLDENSEGLILLTTDGQVSEKVRSKKVQKEYLAQVDGIINSNAIQALKEGVEISVNGTKYRTLPAQVFKLRTDPIVSPSPRGERDVNRATSWISITINEGKFRQVRKMTAAVGFPTLRLIRTRIGGERLAEMQPGDVEEVNSFTLESRE
jgi:23S rRNA pseudouridine2457 synthase